jgi:hypothetical protein
MGKKDHERKVLREREEDGTKEKMSRIYEAEGA